jgi:alpha-ketoglutarate-dependent taurine dioxygenase
MVITATITEEEGARIRLTAPKTPHFNLPHAITTTGRAVPIEHPESSAVDFGAEIYGIDLNDFTDADFEFISDALHRHKLLVFKEQPQMLTPQQQYRLTSQ